MISYSYVKFSCLGCLTVTFTQRTGWLFTIIRAAGEMVFMDASSNMDPDEDHVFLLVTHSSGGGLPLGQ